MNQLFRGVERSRCRLRASRQAFSRSESASALCAQNLITRRAEPNNRRGYSVAPMPLALGHISGHGILRNVDLRDNFSSAIAAEPKLDPRNDDGTFQRPAPSALERAHLAEVTPGHCMHVLQRYAANGAAFIRQSDFVTLCESARPGKMKDGRVIATALREFKKNNRFVLQISGCRSALGGMLRAMTPTWKVQDGRPRVRAALFVAEQILDETTGMYFAVETVLVDAVLEEMQRGLLEMEKNGFKLKVEDVGEDAEAEEEPIAEEKLLRDALRVTGGLVRLLIKRKCRPHLEMKKRARRVYLKKLQFSGGPYASTMQLATHISIMIGGSGVVQESIITPWEEAWWTKRKQVDLSVLKMIEDASKMELAEQKAKGASDGEEEVEGENVERVESIEESGDGDGEEKEDSETEIEAEAEEKKE